MLHFRQNNECDRVPFLISQLKNVIMCLFLKFQHSNQHEMQHLQRLYKNANRHFKHLIVTNLKDHKKLNFSQISKSQLKRNEM